MPRHRLHTIVYLTSFHLWRYADCHVTSSFINNEFVKGVDGKTFETVSHAVNQGSV